MCDLWQMVWGRTVQVREVVVPQNPGHGHLISWLLGVDFGFPKSHELVAGLPMLYLPTPDPSSVDVHADSRVALGLSEAGLPFPGSGSCSETEDPVCARGLERMGTSSEYFVRGKPP